MQCAAARHGLVVAYSGLCITATSLCFAEKSVYTSEVLVTVINHLVEQEVIPTLLMRTVIQVRPHMLNLAVALLHCESFGCQATWFIYQNHPCFG